MLVVKLTVPDRGKGVWEMADFRFRMVARPNDLDDVKPASVLKKTVQFKIGQGRPRKPRLLGGVNGLCRPALGLRPAGLDLDKDDRPAVHGDDIDFTKPRSAATLDHLQPLVPEIPGCSLFPPLSQRDSTALHGKPPQ